MSKSSEKTDAPTPAAEAAPVAEAQKAAETQQPAQAFQVEVDDSHAGNFYANFCRVTGSPEELIIDFGLNPQATGVPSKPITVHHRVVVNFYTAKRLLGALQMAVQRHEAVFGVLETDIQKRVQRART